MVGLAIDLKEALVRVRQAIEVERGDPSKRKGMVAETVMRM